MPLSKIGACDPYHSDHPEWSIYGYQPSLAAGVAFSVLFALSAIAHTWQTIRSRRWWMILFSLGAFGEFLGWVARSKASSCVYDGTLFEMQISLLIFSPAFTSAAIYSILVFIIRVVGTSASPIRPRLYLWIFVIIDLISLILQAIGGGMAASAAGADKDPIIGTNIMISGILFQLVSLCVFTVLFSIVVYRGSATIGQHRSIQLLIAATMFSTVCIIIRGIYRSIELLQGWRGYLIRTEKYQIALDGVMILLSLVIFNILNPATLLKGVDQKRLNTEHIEASSEADDIAKDEKCNSDST